MELECKIERNQRMLKIRKNNVKNIVRRIVFVEDVHPHPHGARRIGNKENKEDNKFCFCQ